MRYLLENTPPKTNKEQVSKVIRYLISFDWEELRQMNIFHVKSPKITHLILLST
jgi:hypothetical protein